MSGVFVKINSTTWKAATNYYVKVPDENNEGQFIWKEINQINAKINSTEWKDSGIIKDNLTIHYDGYNTNSYSGTQTTVDDVAYDWLDLSGNGHHAQVDPSVTSGRIVFDTTEKAFEFAHLLTGSHNVDNISMNYNSGASGSADSITNLTLAVWCKSNSATTNRGGHDQRIIASVDRSSYWRFGVGSDGVGASSAGKVVFGFAGTAANGTTEQIFDKTGSSGSDLRDDSWHYVAVTFTTTQIKFYVDGVNIDTHTGTFGAIGGGNDSEAPRWGFVGNGSEATAFSGITNPKHMFSGKIGAFHYYTSDSDSAATLTDAQILHNFNALKYRYGFT